MSLATGTGGGGELRFRIIAKGGISLEVRDALLGMGATLIVQGEDVEVVLKNDDQTAAFMAAVLEGLDEALDVELIPYPPSEPAGSLEPDSIDDPEIASAGSTTVDAPPRTAEEVAAKKKAERIEARNRALKALAESAKWVLRFLPFF